MGKIEGAIREIHTMEDGASRDQWLNRIHPLVKLCLTIFYVILVVSFDKYDVWGLLGMFVYPFFVFQIGGLSFKEAMWRLRIVIPLVCVVGIWNPFFDVKTVGVVFGVPVRAGVLSMITLMLKGIFAVLSSYLLIATTTIEKICYAMSVLHLPKLFITEIMLIYRYITLLLSEADKMTQAYALRAPGQKGIAYKVWGTLIGQLLLCSVERAENVYDAMSLRGYNGEYYCERIRFCKKDAVYLILWSIIFIVFRRFPVLYFIGNLFV